MQNLGGHQDRPQIIDDCLEFGALVIPFDLKIRSKNAYGQSFTVTRCTPSPQSFSGLVCGGNWATAAAYASLDDLTLGNYSVGSSVRARFCPLASTGSC
jgi:hypothetical protein